MPRLQIENKENMADAATEPEGSVIIVEDGEGREVSGRVLKRARVVVCSPSESHLTHTPFPGRAGFVG